MLLSDLYESATREENLARYRSLEDKIKERGKKADAFFSSSGRAEIIGNHTDHNKGKVIVSAVQCDIACAARKRSDGLVEVCSEGFSPIRVALDDLSIKEKEKGRSPSLVRGVLHSIKKRGYEFDGFSAYTSSTVFRGAGVSSSAAFEVLIAEIVNNFYLNGALSAFEKAKISQEAENDYFGKPCGLLDQTGIALGGLNEVDFLNPSSPQAESLPSPEGYDIFIVNTGGSHSALTAHYAAIRTEMGKVSSFFQKSALREVSEEEFFEALPKLRKTCSERALLRAFHFFEENARVDKAAAALKKNNLSEFFAQVNASGESSLSCLQNAFVPGSDVQPVSLAVKISQKILKGGAVRLHGGGFAGTILAYVSEEEKEEYRAAMSKIFGAENVFSTKTRKFGAGEVSL